jgi:hypothetical protein
MKFRSNNLMLKNEIEKKINFKKKTLKEYQS